MFKKLKNKKGFTLIELIVVIAIISVLAAIIIPSVGQNIARANNARNLANARAAYAETSINVLLGDITAGGTASIPNGTCTYTLDATSGGIATFACAMDANEGASYQITTTGTWETYTP